MVAVLPRFFETPVVQQTVNAPPDSTPSFHPQTAIETETRKSPASNINAYTKNKIPYAPMRRKQKIIEVNAADTADFIALPGIGSKLAARIVLFREKLGGFYKVAQIGEVYGLRDSVFRIIVPNLRCDTALVKKIEINIAEKELLKIHPYIKWNIADALVNYRLQHGAFQSPEDLEKIHAIDSGSLRKMMPYLSFAQ
jgi:DNA uptake protein ComE-like DNA-binding protein